MDYVLHVIVLIGIWVILSASYNLILGHARICAICHAVFFGTGAYGTALLMVTWGWNFWPAMIVGAILAMIISLSIALTALRVYWDYMVVASFGLQYVFYHILMGWQGLTGGPMGVKGIPKVSLFGFEFQTMASTALLNCVMAAIIVLLCRQIANSSFGLVLKGIRDEEVGTRSLGKNLTYMKVAVFAVSAGMAGVAGALFATHMNYLAPYDFVLHFSFWAVVIVAIGGMGNIWGPIIGAIIIIGLPELFRFVNLSSVVVGALREMMLGVFLVLFMLFRPKGIWP